MLEIDQIYQGDCLEVMKQMPDNSVDLVLTDPPYNSNINYDNYADDLPSEEYWAWMQAICSELERIAKVIIIKHSAPKMEDFLLNIKTKRILIWYKTFAFGFPLHNIMTNYEPLYLLKGKPLNTIQDVIAMPSGMCNKEISTGHPAQCPERLVTYLINAFSKEGDLVLDPFLGSGTTAVACINLNRHYIGIELSEEYCKIARQRVADAKMIKDSQPELSFDGR